MHTCYVCVYLMLPYIQTLTQRASLSKHEVCPTPKVPVCPNPLKGKAGCNHAIYSVHSTE